MKSLENLFKNLSIYSKRKRNNNDNVEILPITKKTKLIGFNIISENFNEKTGVYTYRGHFTTKSIKEFMYESLHSSSMRRETSGEVFILKGEIKRIYTGTRNQVSSIPAVPASYHVHPSPKNIMNIDDLFSVPSEQDIWYYLTSFPNTQINFIFDTNGVYIVDITNALITPNGQLKDNPGNILKKYTNVLSKFNTTPNADNYPYYTGIDINEFIDMVETETGGLKIQYIRYDEQNISNVIVDINTVNAL
tara:strand:- start:2645 stop:3391 length:747 start_codon:yes stop_codon:yes gene_type:complete